MVNKIGRYEIQDEIGRGAFGLVHRALDPAIPRLVAIKELTIDADREVLTRFRQEAAAAGNLDSKNIVRIYEYAEHKGKPYIAMEFLEGDNLQQVLKQGKPLSLLDTMMVMSQVAEGLHCAHLHGIVHRDVKPANIMLLDSGKEAGWFPKVKIMDFGIARLNNANSLRMTRAGTLIGTPFYMAPEQFDGVEADFPCDVWAYGVVYYEALTGRVPFYAEDEETLKRKVRDEDALPVQSLNSECPAALQAVIERCMLKDPELRYQSFEDLRFEVEPILIGLRQERAAKLLRDAHDLFDNERWEEAQPLIRETLDLDGGNQEANELRAKIDQQKNRRALAPKLKALVDSGEEEFKKRNFEQAIRKFETALSLDRNNTQITARVEEVRSALEQGKRAKRLIERAQQELNQQNLTGAYSNVLEALESDPDSKEAALLRAQISKQIEGRNRERRWADVIRQVESHRSRGSYDAALSVLDALEREHPGLAQSAVLRRQLLEEQEYEARCARAKEFESSVKEARHLLQRQRFADAITFVEQLRQEYPDETAPAELLREAREGMETQRRGEAVAKTCQDARSSISKQNFTDARRILKEGLLDFPSDPSLQHLLDTVDSLQYAYERDQTVSDALVQARDFRRAGNIQKALDVIGSTLRSVGNDAALANLQRQYEFEQQQQRYSDGLRTVLERAQRLLDDNSAAEAVSFLENAARTYSIEPELNFLLGKARQAQAECEEQAFIADALAESEALERAGELQEALRRLESAARRCPSHPGLRSGASRLRDLVRKQDHDNAVAIETEEIRGMLQSGDSVTAQEAAARAQNRFPQESVFEELRQQALDQIRNGEKTRIAAEIRAAIEKDDFDFARQRIAAAEKAFGPDPLWPVLLEQSDRRASYLESLATAEFLRKKGQHQKAEKCLEAEIARGALDTRASDLLKKISAERTELEREQVVRDGLRETDRLIEAGEYSRALTYLEPLLHSYPNEVGLRRAHKVASEQLEAERRRDLCEYNVRKVLQRSIALENAGQPAEALRQLDLCRVDYPGHPELEKRVALLQDIVFQQEQQRRIATYFKNVHEALDVGDWATAEMHVGDGVEEFPELPEWSEFTEAIRQRRYQGELDDLNRQVRDDLEHDNLDGATRLLAAGRTRFSSEPVWQTLQSETELRRTYKKELRAAERFRQEGDYERAERLLRKVVAQGALDKQAATLLEAISAERADRDRKRKLEDESARAEQLASDGDFDRAIEILEALRRELGEDASLSKTIEAIVQKRAEAVVKPEPAFLEPVPPEVEPSRRPRSPIAWTTSILMLCIAIWAAYGTYRSTDLKPNQPRQKTESSEGSKKTPPPPPTTEQPGGKNSEIPPYKSAGSTTSVVKPGSPNESKLKEVGAKGDVEKKKQEVKLPHGVEPSPGPVPEPPPSRQTPQPVLPPQPDEPAVDCRAANYPGNLDGTIQFIGDLPPNGLLVIGRKRRILTDPVGTLKGQLLPGCAVTLESIIPAGVKVEEEPKLSNSFSRLRIRNTSGQNITSVTIEWRVPE